MYAIAVIAIPAAILLMVGLVLLCAKFFYWYAANHEKNVARQWGYKPPDKR